MNIAISLALGIPVGVFTSLLSWSLLWRWLGPRGCFSPVVCESGGDESGAEYRVKFMNVGWRPMMDVKFAAIIFVPGDRDGRGSQPLIGIPLLESDFHMIGASRGRFHRSRAGILGRPYRTLVLRPDFIAASKLARVPDEFRELLRSGAIGGLRGMLGSGEAASLHVTCTTSDGFTGARRAIISPPYGVDDVVVGAFRRGSSFTVDPFKPSPVINEDQGGSVLDSDGSGSLLGDEAMGAAHVGVFSLDENFLKRVGLEELPSSQKKDFLRYVYEEMEVRVGKSLSEGLDDWQLKEFEAIIDQNEAVVDAWILQHAPNFLHDKIFLKMQEVTKLPAADPRLRMEFVATKWLEINRPDYRKVVAGILDTIAAEVSANKDRILGESAVDTTDPV